MKLSKKQINLEDCMKKEWVITNGIGGYASSTAIGLNTRRYHGLLVAPLTPPAQRHLVLSKLDESIEIDGRKHNLFTNMCDNFVADGYKYLDSFKKEVLPEFTYKINDTKIVKTISMVYERNTVVVQYKIQNGAAKSKLVLCPLINFRDFHHTTPDHNFNLNQTINKNKVKVVIDNNSSTPLYMYVSEGNYIEHFNDTFKNIFYIKEEERGFYPKEDLAVPGRFEIELSGKEKKVITFVASLEENIEQIDSEEVIKKEIKRVNNFVDSSNLLIKKAKPTKAEKEYNELMESLLIADDTFIIYRPAFRTHSLIAGFPWFLDWGRDTMIAYEGLFLIPNKFDLAKEMLYTFTRDIKFGLVPNGYSGFDNRPLYNSADASLLLFEQVNKYLKYTKDYDFIEKEIYDCLKDIIENYSNGIDIDDNNIYIAEEGLLNSGTDHTQNTWMDAKVGDMAVTPRNGRVVELNALWYNALKTLEALATKFGEKQVAENCKKVATKHKKTFEKYFYNKKKHCLYDVVGDDRIRPNQLFAISTTYPVVKPSSDIGKEIFNTCQDKLLTKFGLRTLSKNDSGYIAIYEGDSFKRDMSYHQGVSWPWLLGLYYDALDNIVNDEKDRLEKEKYLITRERFIETIFDTFKKEVNQEEGIGTINELYDSKPPYKAGGTFSQAWSVSEIIKIVSKRNG